MTLQIIEKSHYTATISVYIRDLKKYFPCIYSLVLKQFFDSGQTKGRIQAACWKGKKFLYYILGLPHPDSDFMFRKELSYYSYFYISLNSI